MIAISRTSSSPNPSGAMSCVRNKHLLFSILLLDFTFTNQFLQAQTLIGPNFDEALLPFGSHAITGTLSTRCNRHEFDGSVPFTLRNNCPFTVWAAAIPGGGQQLQTNEAWVIDVPSGTTGGRIWGRTNCSFDKSGRGNCQTGDCGGVLQCVTFGSPPNTLAEFALDQFNDLDFFDVSLVDGFNIPMEFTPTSNGCSRGIRCAADINGQCPKVLKVAGGCNNPCTVFKTDEYCCSNSSTSCKPTNYSKFFKDQCPDAYSYPMDDATSTFTCPGAGATNYAVVFCPS